MCMKLLIVLKLKQSNFGIILLSCIVGIVIISSDHPLDFHDKILSLLATNLKYLIIGLNTNQLCVPSSSKWLLPIK